MAGVLPSLSVWVSMFNGMVAALERELKGKARVGHHFLEIVDRVNAGEGKQHTVHDKHQNNRDIRGNDERA